MVTELERRRPLMQYFGDAALAAAFAWALAADHPTIAVLIVVAFVLLSAER